MGPDIFSLRVCSKCPCFWISLVWTANPFHIKFLSTEASCSFIFYLRLFPKRFLRAFYAKSPTTAFQHQKSNFHTRNITNALALETGNLFHQGPFTLTTNTCSFYTKHLHQTRTHFAITPFTPIFFNPTPPYTIYLLHQNLVPTTNTRTHLLHQICFRQHAFTPDLPRESFYSI